MKIRPSPAITPLASVAPQPSPPNAAPPSPELPSPRPATRGVPPPSYLAGNKKPAVVGALLALALSWGSPGPALADLAARPDPAPVTQDRGTVRLGVAPGVLFRGGIAATDVAQGQISACFFAAALSAVAHGQPQTLSENIEPTAQGYRVRLFSGGQPVWVDISAQLYLDGAGQIFYSRGVDPQELWPALYEKAYAQWQGSYQAIGAGGDLVAPLTALTGRPVQLWAHNQVAATTLWHTIAAALAAGRPVVAGTWGPERAEKYQGENLFYWHAYAVLKTEVQHDQVWVWLRNPWGHTEPGRLGQDVDWNQDGAPEGNDGIFKISLNQLLYYFQETAVGQ